MAKSQVTGFAPQPGAQSLQLSAAAPRRSLADYAAADSGPARPRRLAASYDSARDEATTANHWANADSLDADAANSKMVRGKLVARSRYEFANNGYLAGIGKRHCDYMVGTGPSLRVQTADQQANNNIEMAWRQWSQRIRLARKLWCLCHAKVQDGEGLALCVNNPRVRHPVKLDLRPIETEMCQSPSVLLDRALNRIDGITFDSFGDPLTYEILQEHPGSQYAWLGAKTFAVDARYVLHWFRLLRPGQHRGIPEFTSTLNLGAASRRMREATVGAVETAAEMGAAILHTSSPPDSIEPIQPMSSMDIQKRMMTALPMGWDLTQMQAQHPNATYDSFLQQTTSELASPISMPKNIAMCDSSAYNYASGRLDHQTYFSGLNVERANAELQVLDPIFELWWNELVITTGLPRDLLDQPPPHSWDWPKHPVADARSEAQATDVALANATKSLTRVYAENGLDWQDELPRLAADLGLSVDELQERLADKYFPVGGREPATTDPAEPIDGTEHRTEGASGRGQGVRGRKRTGS